MDRTTRLSAIGLAGLLFCTGGLQRAATAEPEEPGRPAVMSTVALAERSFPTVVAIDSETARGVASGTGFTVDSTGKVVTSLHVIRDATKISVRLHDGREFDDVRIVGLDHARDLAVLRIKARDLPFLPLGDSDAVSPGQPIVVVGNPLGFEHTITEGIVSGVRSLDSGVRVIQIDAAASPGSSGGPVINRRGEVIGVVSTSIAEGEGLHFALPVDYARPLISQDTEYTLAEAAGELQRRQELFKLVVASGATGRWKSLLSDEVIFLKQDGDRIYGETTGASGATYELVKQGDDSYSGFRRYTWRCRVAGRVPYIENTCRFEDPVEVSLSGGSRIEGTVFVRHVPPASKTREFTRYCKACGSSVNREPQKLAWFKTD